MAQSSKCLTKVAVSVILGLSFATVSVFAQNTRIDPVREYRQANEIRLLSDYVQLLSIPNVASDTNNIRRNADFLVERMRKAGLNPRLLEAADKKVPPVVFGEYSTPGATKTIIFYAHYDGQPTDPKQWTGSEPWVPVLRSNALEKGGKTIPFPKNGERIDPEWRIYARSASDDKAGVFSILTALEALRAKDIKPTVNIKFFFEGEEEAGSPNLKEILTNHKDLLKADAFIVCDGPVHQSGRKQVVFDEPASSSPSKKNFILTVGFMSFARRASSAVNIANTPALSSEADRAYIRHSGSILSPFFGNGIVLPTFSSAFDLRAGSHGKLPVHAAGSVGCPS